MTRSAYYSRNNSYSRSYGAECAERNEKFPMTRAAKYLGLSVKAFKDGLEASGITASEWHHVGKYANEVDYYDVSDESEIVASYSFWKGASNKANKAICEPYYRNALKVYAHERLTTKMSAWDRVVRNPKFAKDFIAKCNNAFVRSVVMMAGDQSLKGPSQFVKYGTHSEDEYRVGHTGVYYTGRVIHNCASGSHINPFSLHPANLARLKREISLKKYDKFLEKRDRDLKVKSCINRENVKKILDRKVRGCVHNNSLSFCTPQDNVIAAHIIERNYPAQFIIEYRDGGAYITGVDKYYN